jgi:hypothetical protein
MLSHFLRAVFIQGGLFNVLREEREGRDAKPRRLSFLPAGKLECPVLKSTGFFQKNNNP